MKKILLSGCALAALLAAPAMAADLPRRAPPPPPAPVLYNWSGWYMGLNAGGTWGNSDVVTSTTAGTYFAATSVGSINTNGVGSIDSNGFTGGGQIGFNWQTGTWVFGLEADLQFFRHDDARVIGPVVYPCCAPTTYTLSQGVETDWLFTFRGRLGVAANNWLWYVTGGLALTEVTSSFTFTDTFAAALAGGSASDTQVGWTVGGGLEWGIAPNWTLRGEYLYVRFDDVSLTSNNLVAGGVAIPSVTFAHTGDLTAHIARAAINWKF